MSQLIVMIAKMDGVDNPERLVEVWRGAMPEAELSRVRPEHYMDELENAVMGIGWEAMRHLLEEQWRLICRSEQAEVEALEQLASLEGLKAQLSAAGEPRRPAAWVAELNQAIEEALEQPTPQPPPGVSATDWERVVRAHQANPMLSAGELRRLGPQVQPDEVVASVDEIAVRRPEKRRFLGWGPAFGNDG
jgi:hypothetical protein